MMEKPCRIEKEDSRVSTKGWTGLVWAIVQLIFIPLTCLMVLVANIIEMMKPHRENKRVPTEGWSNWVRAMVPDEKVLRPSSYTKRDGSGYYCNNITTAFDNMDCGVYEWKAVHDEGEDYVVYIGSTYVKTRGPNAGALERRIMEYCRDGSHKRDDINRALYFGYELHVRVNETGCSKEDAEDAENVMLDNYNYAWNVRDNEPYRGEGIPPPV